MVKSHFRRSMISLLVRMDLRNLKGELWSLQLKLEGIQKKYKINWLISHFQLAIL